MKILLFISLFISCKLIAQKKDFVKLHKEFIEVFEGDSIYRCTITRKKFKNTLPIDFVMKYENKNISAISYESYMQGCKDFVEIIRFDAVYYSYTSSCTEYYKKPNLPKLKNDVGIFVEENINKYLEFVFTINDKDLSRKKDLVRIIRINSKGEIYISLSSDKDFGLLYGFGW